MHANSRDEGSQSSSSEGLFDRIQNPQNTRSNAIEMVPAPVPKQNPLDIIKPKLNDRAVSNSVLQHDYLNVVNPYNNPHLQSISSDSVKCQCKWRTLYDILVMILLLYCTFGVTYLGYHHISPDCSCEYSEGKAIENDSGNFISFDTLFCGCVQSY